MKNTLKTLLVAIAVGAASSASAIMYDSATNGVNAVGGDFTAIGGSVAVKNGVGITVTGVSGGPAGNEIDVGQTLVLSLDKSFTLKSLTLGLLFNGDEYTDPQEIAKVTANGSVSYTLSIVAENLAVWSNGGINIPVDPGFSTTLGGGGVFTLLSPFGGMLISTLEFTPVSNPSTVNNSDFGLVAYEIPDSSTTLALLGLALVGVVSIRRRFKA